jgi:hypothetical protein
VGVYAAAATIIKRGKFIMKHQYANALCLLILISIAVFSGCVPPEQDPLEIPNPVPPYGLVSNGPLTETAWAAFAAHVYSGPEIGDSEMDGSDIILINSPYAKLRF